MSDSSQALCKIPLHLINLAHLILMTNQTSSKWKKVENKTFYCHS